MSSGGDSLSSNLGGYDTSTIGPGAWDSYYSGVKSAADTGLWNYLGNEVKQSQNTPDYWKDLLGETRTPQTGLSTGERLELPVLDMYSRLRETDNPQSSTMQALKMVVDNSPSLREGALYTSPQKDVGLPSYITGGQFTDAGGKSNIWLAPDVGSRADPGMVLSHEIGHSLGGKVPMMSSDNPGAEGFAVGFQTGLYGDKAAPKQSYDTVFGEHPAYLAAKELGMNTAKQVLSGGTPDQAAINRQLLEILGRKP